MMSAGEHHQVVVIGGGPAGLAAACAAAGAGCDDVLVVERSPEPGGILVQCIHDGFGLDLFRESLTGPEWARRFLDRAVELGVGFMTDAMVLELRDDRTMLVSRQGSLFELSADAVVLAMGCRERTRDALVIPGTRPAGVFTAGLAQHLINLKGYMVGRSVVVLGSGDVGMIMARRLTLEGARVLACVEILPYPSGLPRNVVQCLDDFGIPLMLGHTVTRIHGNERVEGVTTARVDADMLPVPGTEQYHECDTLLLSVGLIPENELSKGAGVEMDPVTGGAVVDENMATTVPGVFAAGNVLHVHDLVDEAALEAGLAGSSAYRFASGELQEGPTVPVEAGEGVSYVVPQRVHPGTEGVTLRLRVSEPGREMGLEVSQGGRTVSSGKVLHATPPVMVVHTVKGAVEAGGGAVTVSLTCGDAGAGGAAVEPGGGGA